MAATVREKGSGESQETESATIKERNSRDYVDLSGKRLATPARSLAHRLPATATASAQPTPMARPGLAGGGARACGTPVSFSQLLN